MATSNTQQMWIEFDRRVLMRDGITLSADVYCPADAKRGANKYPVILMRTPYVKANAAVVGNAKYYTERGYIYISMDVRGRGDSDGEFVPYVNDGRDGYDAIE